MSALEEMVNVWMDAEHPRIRHTCQTMRGNHILLSFVYEETRELEHHVSARTQSATVPRFYDDEYADERPTNPQIPVTPPPVQAH